METKPRELGRVRGHCKQNVAWKAFRDQGESMGMGHHGGSGSLGFLPGSVDVGTVQRGRAGGGQRVSRDVLCLIQIVQRFFFVCGMFPGGLLLAIFL